VERERGGRVREKGGGEEEERRRGGEEEREKERKATRPEAIEITYSEKEKRGNKRKGE
jgi:hypothetical protein